MQLTTVFTILAMALTAASAPMEDTTLSPRTTPPPVTSCSPSQTVCCPILSIACNVLTVLPIGSPTCQGGVAYCCQSGDINQVGFLNLNLNVINQCNEIIHG